MKIYLAPMEGITGYNFRNTYQHHFSGADRYFTPFISTHKKLGNKVKDEINPDNNSGIDLIPQVMIADAKEFFELQNLITPFGYSELNINAGCPSGTVVNKHRGSGLIKDPYYLDDVLIDIFKQTKAPVSIKTRIGWEDTAEWEKLAEIIGQYPFSEVIIHTRVREEFYNGQAHREAMEIAKEYIHSPICYNGDIFTAEDAQNIVNSYPWLDSVMIGRGLLQRPWIIDEIRKREMADGHIDTHENPDLGTENVEAAGAKKISEEARLSTHNFLQELYDTYLAKWQSEINTLFHMKEIWFHLGKSFPEYEKELKTIKKTKNTAEYKSAVQRILLQ